VLKSWRWGRTLSLVVLVIYVDRKKGSERAFRGELITPRLFLLVKRYVC
jgi:hypothetical protein